MIPIISEDDYSTIIQQHQPHLDKLIEIIKSSNEPLEGNCFYIHNSLRTTPLLISKQRNIFSLSRIVNNCIEIGFNAGHSALLMLLANPNLKLTVFDICEHKYTEPCFEYLSSIFGNRLTLIKGDSKSTLPQYADQYPDSIDMIHVDGSHEFLQSNLDFYNSRRIAKHDSYLIWDDIWIHSQQQLWNGYIKDKLIKPVNLLPTTLYPHVIGTFHKPKIAVLTLAIGENYKQIIRYGRKTKIEYAKLHNYDFHDEEEVYDTTRPPAWSKIKLIERYLSKYDYVVWIDADTLIMSYVHKLENIIYDHMEDKDIMVTRDWQSINTGVIFVKNTEWSKLFLKCIYEERQYIDHVNWEQTSFIHLYDCNALDSQKHIQVLPASLQYTFNSYWFNYYPGHFILHFPGCYKVDKDTKLETEMLRFCPIKMDEEDEGTYNFRKWWLGKEVRGYIDHQLGRFKYYEKGEDKTVGV